MKAVTLKMNDEMIELLNKDAKCKMAPMSKIIRDKIINESKLRALCMDLIMEYYDRDETKNIMERHGMSLSLTQNE